RHCSGAKQALRQVLVHCGSARDVIAARVRKARKIQNRLNTTVLSRTAMQSEENDIHITNVAGIRGEHHRRLAHAGESCAGGWFGTDAAGQHLLLDTGGQPPGRRVDRYYLMPEAAQRGDDLSSAGDRDIALLTRATKQNRDLHAGIVAVAAAAVRAEIV